MPDFTKREIKVFDTLTLIVLMEQGDLDYTMIEYWDCSQAWRPPPEDPTPWLAQVPVPDWKRRGPELLQCCLACLCKRRGRFVEAEENRAFLLDTVKRGDVQITRAWLRTELTHCAGCGNKPTKVVNPQWLDSLKT